MGLSEEAKHKRNALASGIAGVLALIILFISISRASLDTTITKDNSLDTRKLPIEYEIGKDKYTYKLPQARTVIGDPMYAFKKFRDILWIEFTSDTKSRSEVALFIADKKMAEAVRLFQDGKTELALLTTREALNKLQYASRIYENDQIYYAGFAYAKILSNYNQKLKELDDWNWAQQIKKETKK